MQSEREELRKLIEGGDGRYSGNLVLKQTTHLVAAEPIGPKYEAAVANHLKIVIPQWITDCRKRNRWLNENDYELSKYETLESPSKGKTETERWETSFSVHCSILLLSNMVYRKIKQQKLQEQLLAEKKKKAEENARRLKERAEAETQVLRDYLEGNSDTLDILETCWIYLHGFDPARMKRMADIVQCSGATLLFECHPCVTHVVVGDAPNRAHLADIRQVSAGMQVVQSQWLFDSFHDHTYHDECSYLFFQPKKAPASKGAGDNRGEGDNTENLKVGANRPPKRARSEEERESLPVSVKKRRRDGALPLTGQLVCVSRYMGEERERVKVLTE